VSRERDRTVCVLGGTGFVGRHLAASFIRDGWALRVPTRSIARHRDLLVLPGVTLVQTNVHDPAALRRVCTGCGTVINLIGILNEGGRKSGGFAAVHVELARQVVAAGAELGIGRLLHMSALKADQPDPPSNYLRTKGEAEGVVRAASGLAWTIFRPSTIFGPGDSFINRFDRLLRWPAPFFPLPRADARFAPVYVGDVVQAFRRALTETETVGKSYELCGPRVYTLAEIVSAIARARGQRRRVLPIPDWLARMQARVMALLPGTPFSMDNFLSLTIDAVCTEDGLRALGLTPLPLEAELRRQLGMDARPKRYERLRRSARQ
jgi:NADH dehydrogenase